MQNLTSYVLFTGHGESAPLPGLECRSLFELRGGHMHKDPVAQELSSISDSCMAKKVSTTRGSNCQVHIMEGSKFMVKSSATREKACLPAKVLGEEECLTYRK